MNVPVIIDDFKKGILVAVVDRANQGSIYIVADEADGSFEEYDKYRVKYDKDRANLATFETLGD